MCQYFEDTHQLEIITEEIAEYIAKLESIIPQDDDFSVGDPLLAKSTTDDTWFRAEILYVNAKEQTATVEYVDCGTIDRISLIDALPIPPDLALLQKQAVTYTLCKPSGGKYTVWTKESLAEFEDLANFVEYIPATIQSMDGDIKISVQSGPLGKFLKGLK